VVVSAALATTTLEAAVSTAPAANSVAVSKLRIDFMFLAPML
jgi:hypothetical protein